MSEIALTAEHVIVVGRGRLIADTSVEEIVARASARRRGARPHAGCGRVARGSSPRGGRSSSDERDVLEVHGLPSERIGEIAMRAGVVLHELTPQKASLEDAYMALTGDSVEYRAAATAARHRDWSPPHEHRRRHRPRPRRRARGRVTQRNVIRSEWTKLWSLRSTRWSLLAAVVARALSGSWSPPSR